MHSDVSEAEKTVKKLETTWQELQVSFSRYEQNLHHNYNIFLFFHQTEYQRIENLLEKATEEQHGPKGSNSLKNSLTNQIREQEELAESLSEVCS